MSRASDRPYVSKWKHYQQLLFLCEACDEDDGSEDLQVLTQQEDKDREHGNQTPSSTLSGFSSSSNHTSSIKHSAPPAPSNSTQSDAKTSTSYQIFLSATPDNLKLTSQSAASTLPVSPSTSLPDSRSCTNPSPLNFSTVGSVQPDGRLSADSRCLWSESKVQQLISFYSGRRHR